MGERKNQEAPDCFGKTMSITPAGGSFLLRCRKKASQVMGEERGKNSLLAPLPKENSEPASTPVGKEGGGRKKMSRPWGRKPRLGNDMTKGTGKILNYPKKGRERGHHSGNFEEGHILVRATNGR